MCRKGHRVAAAAVAVEFHETPPLVAEVPAAGQPG
jgi:hypothetical protein